MAVASVFLIWFKKDKDSLNAGFRYILMHIFGGCCLLTGIIIYTVSKGSIAIDLFEHSAAYWFILVGFGLNTAFIPIHTWLPDAYPEGTITGSVFLSECVSFCFYYKNRCLCIGKVFFRCGIGSLHGWHYGSIRCYICVTTK